MCEVKANQTWTDADGDEVTIVSVKKATAQQMRVMGSKFAASMHAGYDSQDKVVSFTEDGSKLIHTLTLGGFVQMYKQA